MMAPLRVLPDLVKNRLIGKPASEVEAHPSKVTPMKTQEDGGGEGGGEEGGGLVLGEGLGGLGLGEGLGLAGLGLGLGEGGPDCMPLVFRMGALRGAFFPTSFSRSVSFSAAAVQCTSGVPSPATSPSAMSSLRVVFVSWSRYMLNLATRASPATTACGPVAVW